MPGQIADEVLQSSLLKIWDNIENYDPKVSGFYTWMTVIARNTAIDQRRLKAYKAEAKSVELDKIVYQKTVSIKEGVSIDVNRLLAALDEKHRIVLEYAYLRGYTHIEIAEALDMPLGTVKTRIREGIKVLRLEVRSDKDAMGHGLGLLGIILFATI